MRTIYHVAATRRDAAVVASLLDYTRTVEDCRHTALASARQLQPDARLVTPALRYKWIAYLIARVLKWDPTIRAYFYDRPADAGMKL